jgi:benzoate 4-monooxygenase
MSLDTDNLTGMEAGLLPLTRRLFAWHPFKKAGADYENVIYHNTKARLRDPTTDNDIFSNLLRDNKGAEMNLSAGDLLAECAVMMNGGTETTAAAFTNTLYLIYKHPAVLEKLREEVDSACGPEEVASYATLSQLPYLRACVEESLRVRPPSSFGLPRVVPPGGRMIAGQWVDEGVTVSVPRYSLLRDEEAFEHADSFVPDRWMTADKAKKDRMMKSHVPFSIGPRACIGRNIAYYEQLLVISTLVRWFDFDIPDDVELQTIERFNSNPGELVIRCKRRQV